MAVMYKPAGLLSVLQEGLTVKTVLSVLEFRIRRRERMRKIAVLLQSSGLTAARRTS